MNGRRDTRVEQDAAAVIRELDRLIETARHHEAAPPPADRPGHGSDAARSQREWARELRRSAEATRHKAVALCAETQALVDQALCAGIEWREWPRARAVTDRTVDLNVTEPHPAEVRQVAPARHQALVRAIRFMEEHAREPIGVADIAGASGVGARHLQGLFRHDHEGTPMDYLRRLRLDHVHDELCRADSTRGHTVEAIAREWQFTHLGRFAAAYRRRFGCVPSRTLRALGGDLDGQGV